MRSLLFFHNQHKTVKFLLCLRAAGLFAVVPYDTIETSLTRFEGDQNESIVVCVSADVDERTRRNVGGGIRQESVREIWRMRKKSRTVLLRTRAYMGAAHAGVE